MQFTTNFATYVYPSETGYFVHWELLVSFYTRMEVIGGRRICDFIEL